MFKSLLKSPMVRAYALAAARHAATLIGGVLAAWLIKHGVASADATTLAEGIGALVIPAVSIGFSLLDVKRVDTKMKTDQAITAATVASAIQTGATTPAAVASQAQAALSQGDGASKQLNATLATLRAGAA